MNAKSWLWGVILFFFIQGCHIQLFAQKIRVIESIPGRNPSEHYVCRVKFEQEDESAWRSVFVLQTRAKEEAEDPKDGYYPNLRGWTASWIAFESDFEGESIIVEIAIKDGTPITEAMVRPAGDASVAEISNGKAYVTFTKPANVNIDINGQLEHNYTGHGYYGPDVHTISIFANPMYHVPDPSSSGVKILQPGEDINTLNRADWDTLIFAPGVHNIGVDEVTGEPTPFQILSNEVLFIPGDAVVHGTIHPKNAWGTEASRFWTVYGSGTISGEKILRTPSDQANKTTKPFTYQAEGARLEGFVVEDPAFHTFNMGNSADGTSNINVYKNLKILAWRKNSDGINAFRHSEVSDCFFRVQDDAFYIGQKDVNQHNNVVWNDANGAVLFIQSAPDASTNVFRDVKVIYHRAYWHWWTGGRIVSMRETPSGTTISNVLVSNILVEDPLPAFPPFYATMLNDQVSNVTLNNIVMENIYQEHPGVSTNTDSNQGGKPQNTLIGTSSSKWENITFRNCYFNGKDLTSFEDGNFKIENVDATTVIFDITNSPPVADFSVNTTEVAIGQSVNFYDNSSNNPTKWKWTFDGGTPSSSELQNPVITYNTNGAFDVKLVASNEYGEGAMVKTGLITVSDSVPVNGITIDNCPITEIKVGTEKQLLGILAPDNATDKRVIWNSSDPSVIQVASNGIITATAPGKATIIASTPDEKFTESCEVSVIEDRDKIFNFSAPHQVAPGDTVTVSVEYEAGGDRDIRVFLQQDRSPWNIYGSSTFAVSEGKRTDQFQFIVDSETPIDIDGYKMVVNILPVGGSWPDRFDEVSQLGVGVIVFLESLEITNCPETAIESEAAYQFGVSFTPADATIQEVTWESTDVSVATVDTEGLVLGISDGSAIITVTSINGGHTSSCLIQVKKEILSVVNGQPSIRVFPNPVEGYLNLEFMDAGQRSIRIYNIVGNLLMELETNWLSERVDLESLGIKGQIFVLVRSERSINRFKILVK